MQATTDFVMVILRKSRGWILEDNVSVYKPIGREARMLRMNLNSSILNLRRIVVQKLNMENMAFGLRYAVPASEELIEIVDDDDVYNFLTYAFGESPNLVTLFVEIDNSEDVDHGSGGRDPVNVGRGEYQGMEVNVNAAPHYQTLGKGLGHDFFSQLQSNPLVSCKLQPHPQYHPKPQLQNNHQHQPQFHTNLKYQLQPQIQPEQPPKPQRLFQTDPTNLPQSPEAANRVEPTASQTLYKAHVLPGSKKVHCETKVPVLVHDESIHLYDEHGEDFSNCTESVSSLIGSVDGDEGERDSCDDMEVKVEEDDESPEPYRRGASKGPKEQDRGKVPYRKGVDYLGSMPPLLPDQVTSKPCDVSMNHIRTCWIKVNQTFKSKQELKVALGRKCLEECFETKTKKSDKNRLMVVCMDNGCEWYMRAVRLPGGKVFMVRKLIDKHTCPRNDRPSYLRHATPPVIGSIIKDVLTENKMVYKGKDIVADMALHYKLNVTYTQAWRAKCYALELLNGTPEESFRLLPSYCHNLKLRNPGTFTAIDTDDQNRFQKLFVAYGFAIRTFQRHVRQVLILYETHLKGKYLKTMFVAVAMDGEQKSIPIAIGFGNSETTDCWTWFLSRLKESIGDMANRVLISDRASSIAAAIDTVFPDAFHGSCCWHLWMNLRTKCNKTEQIRWLYWKACKAYRVCDFEQRLLQIGGFQPKAIQFLSTVDVKKWSRAHFPGMRYNLMTSNSVDFLNSLTVFARKLPIVKLLDYIRGTLQQWYYDRRQHGGQLLSSSNTTSWAAMKIQNRTRKCASWKVIHISDSRFQVIDGLWDGDVDLERRTCTCRKWALSGIPCGHAIAAMNDLGQGDLKELVHTCYKATTYKNSYEELVHPVGPPSTWLPSENDMMVEPPVMGKQQFERLLNKDQISSEGDFLKPKRCSRCKTYGHISSKCPIHAPHVPKVVQSQIDPKMSA